LFASFAKLLMEEEEEEEEDILACVPNGGTKTASLL